MLAELLQRARRRGAKLLRTARARVVTPGLRMRSRYGRRELTDPSGRAVVSLTSYGARLNTVHLTIESIARGRIRPRRLILWTDPGVVFEDLPPQLRRLRLRGLEVRSSPEAFGPHTKYYPYVVSEPRHDRPLVTADDDSIYEREWLARLVAASELHPGEIVCYRAHRVGVAADGKSLRPYNTWRAAVGGQASWLNFATGVSGVLYPPAFLNELRDDGSAFTERCPRADDVWLHFRAVAHGRRIRQIVPVPKKYPEIAATQASALHRTNTALSGNDPQIAATYDAQTIVRLARLESSDA